MQYEPRTRKTGKRLPSFVEIITPLEFTIPATSAIGGDLARLCLHGSAYVSIQGGVGRSVHSHLEVRHPFIRERTDSSNPHMP